MTQNNLSFQRSENRMNKQTVRFYVIAVMSASRKFSIKAGGYKVLILEVRKSCRTVSSDMKIMILKTSQWKTI